MTANDYTCILVDDERNSRIVLKDLLKNFCKEVTVVGEASNVQEAYNEIIEKKPNLVFLDIQMPTGNGFSLLSKFDVVPFDVIFITSYDTYAINAIKFSALDYLLKPVDINELVAAVNKAIAKHESNTRSQSQIVNLLNNVDEDESKRTIAFHKSDSVRLVKVTDICYMTADSNYSRIKTSAGEEFISSKTLKEFEEFLSRFSFFIRIHKSCIINVQFIEEYSKGEPCILTMTDGTEHEISRRKKKEVLSVLKF